MIQKILKCFSGCIWLEACYENRAVEAKNPAFHIFALKNFGWQDKVVQEVTQREIKVTLEDDEE